MDNKREGFIGLLKRSENRRILFFKSLDIYNIIVINIFLEYNISIILYI